MSGGFHLIIQLFEDHQSPSELPGGSNGREFKPAVQEI